MSSNGFNQAGRKDSRQSSFVNELLPLLLAFSWHLGDAYMHMTPQKKKARAMWVGVGVGWSAFWLVRYFVKRKPLVETKGYYETK